MLILMLILMLMIMLSMRIVFKKFVSPNSHPPTHQVVCKAGEAKPKPVFSWTLDGKPLTGLETRDEEVRIIFLLSQIIISSVLGDGGH